jgi:hypothetical protein
MTFFRFDIDARSRTAGRFIGRADLAWALDREITFELRRPDNTEGQNVAPVTSTIGHKPARIIGPKTPNE